MQMRLTLGHPLLVTAYSASLLFIGSAVGAHCARKPATALWLCSAGGVLMAIHDATSCILFFWLTARWARSSIERSKHG
jgi:hypothetical protein